MMNKRLRDSAFGVVLACSLMTPGDGMAQGPFPCFRAEPGFIQAVAADSRIVPLPPVNFNLSSWYIQPEYSYLLDTLAKAMLDPQLTGQKFIIQGHTDYSGSFQYNLTLSCFRALSVVEYLVTRGVPADRLSAQGFSWLYLKDNRRPYSRVNRRIEVLTYR